MSLVLYDRMMSNKESDKATDKAESHKADREAYGYGKIPFREVRLK